LRNSGSVLQQPRSGRARVDEGAANSRKSAKPEHDPISFGRIMI
jgi:hypothetical protein